MEPHIKMILAAGTSHTKTFFYNMIGFAYKYNNILVLFVLIGEPNFSILLLTKLDKHKVTKVCNVYVRKE